MIPARDIVARLRVRYAQRAAVLRVVSRATRSLRTQSLTIFRMGLGRDSLAMLGLLLEGGLLANGRRYMPDDIDAVVFTDPGMEWANTYALIPTVAKLCAAHGLRFLVQSKAPEAEQKAWTAYRPVGSKEAAPWRAERAGESIEDRAARGYYHARVGIMADYGSKGMIVPYAGGGCTAVHKIGPNRALMADLADERFGVKDNGAWGRAVKKGQRPPHLVLIGIAADETARQGECDTPDYETTAYPLVEMGVAKGDEQPILDRWGFGAARKSGCVMCKFQPLEWYWALRELEPARFDDVAAYEANALKTSPNLLLFPRGVTGGSGWVGDPRPAKERLRLTLAPAVDYWRSLNPTATVEDVLAKTYACAATPKIGAKQNPAACLAPRYAFALDLARLTAGMQGDGFDSATWED